MSLGIEAKKSDFNEWYNEIVRKCDIVDIRYPVKGFPVYRHWGTFLIKRITSALEEELEEAGHSPMSFPVVIPEKNLDIEKEHAKGFHEEVFWITHAGKNQLDEKLFLRPSSETAIYPMFSTWVRSHTDLPLKMYQSCQVYRYETKMTKPLLRGREFFWIETHTVQKNNEAAVRQVSEDMRIAGAVISEKLALPFLLLQRPEWDKFPGADSTYAYDTLLPDGRTLQIATTHNLGQKFAKAFSIKYASEKSESVYACQTCFGPGVSRMVASIIAVHGDDHGLIMPPNIAPLQAIIIPILVKGKESIVDKKCKEVLDKLKKSGLRVKYDNSDKSPGFKFNEWELRGVPLRIEIGPKDIEAKSITFVRRDIGEKKQIKEKDMDSLSETLDKMFEDIKAKAQENFDSRIATCSSMKEAEKHIEKGFVRANFCSLKKDGEKWAEKIEKELGAKIRGVMFGRQNNAQSASAIPEKPFGACIACGSAGEHVVYVARAY